MKQVAHRDLCAPVETWGKFDRMRDLLSAQAKQRLTEGETLDRLTEDGLDKHDPLRKAKRAAKKSEERRRRRSRVLRRLVHAPLRRSRNAVCARVRRRR